MVKVFLDPGHGGSDPGALGNGLREKDIALSATLKIGEILKNHNVEVYYSRTTDVFIELSERARKANNIGTNIFVSIHCNAYDGTAKGVETYSYPGAVQGAKLSKNILDSIIASGVYASNRGTKTANFAVLRETNMTAALVEMAFIDNPQDADILKYRQDDLAKAISKGILNYLGIKYVANNKEETKKTPIIGKATATVEQMKKWAMDKGANQKFIDLAPLFYSISNKAGINPIVTYTQSAKETGYMKFGGVLDITYNNPCGMKILAGGGDKDPNAHKRFENWEEGIQAQVDHLALYAGANGYPKSNTPDPRHFPYLKGSAATVESLGGKWAPSSSYGTDIAKMIKEVENTKVPSMEEAKEEKQLNKIKIDLHGKQLEVKGIYEEGANYIPVRFLENLGYKIDWKNGAVTINYKEDK